MTNKIILLLFVLGSYCCTESKYITKRQSEIIKLDLDNSVTNFIPLSDDDLNKSKILDSTYILLINKKYSKLNNYINSLKSSESTSSDIFLSKTLLLISKREYSSALFNLEKIKEGDYVLLKRLLSVDLSCELSKAYGYFDFNRCLNSYQGIIDSYPENNSLKKIIAIRLRYLRYNN